MLQVHFFVVVKDVTFTDMDDKHGHVETDICCHILSGKQHSAVCRSIDKVEGWSAFF